MTLRRGRRSVCHKEIEAAHMDSRGTRPSIGSCAGRERHTNQYKEPNLTTRDQESMERGSNSHYGSAERLWQTLGTSIVCSAMWG
jgi:hypothetical protein